MKPIRLYYGDNGSHEFWEDPKGATIIIRNHGESNWFFLMLNYDPLPPIDASPVLERLLGEQLQLDKSKQWILPRKHGRMVLK